MTWRGISVFALSIALLGALMLAPAAMAAYEGAWTEAQAFSQSAGFTFIVAIGVGLAAKGGGARSAQPVRAEILTVIGVFTLAPLVGVAPLLRLEPALPLSAASFEMISMATTTGASALGDLDATPRAVHLWRVAVAWYGGFAALTAAAAVLTPRNLGGAEIQSAGGSRTGGKRAARAIGAGAPGESGGARVAQAVRLVFPVYFSITVAMIAAGLIDGREPLFAVADAVALVSTSGVSVGGGGFAAGGSILFEAVALLAMAAAATRHVYRTQFGLMEIRGLRGDPELQLMVVAVSGAALWLFLRHWIGAIEVSEGATLAEAGSALWGAVFTALSFLTTTGVVSGSWTEARDWSGLSNPGMILLALGVLGGGVASTAGGVKLLRAHALFRHSGRELARLSHPSSVGGAGSTGRAIRREGALAAWVFMMLFIGTLAGVLVALSLAGAPLDQAAPAAVAALTTTGPAYEIASPGHGDLGNFPDAVRWILCVAMALGRLETLAIVALLNPEYWRR